MLRWAVDISAWEPQQQELDYLLGLLPEEEAQACAAFRRDADRKRALASRLLQRRACCTALCLSWGDVQIERTRGRKPYCANAGGVGGGAGAADRSAAPNWNFNVSHEVGCFVMLLWCCCARRGEGV